MNSHALQKDHSLQAIVPIVLLLHGLLLFWMLQFSTETAKPVVPKKLTVASIKLAPKAPPQKPKQQATPKVEKVEAPAKQVEVKAPEPQPQPEPQQAPKPKAKVEAKPQPKVETKPKTPPKKATPVAKKPEKTAPKKPPAPAKPQAPTVQAKTPPPVDEKKKNLLNQARETIGKINLKNDKTIATAPLQANLPQRIENLSIDQMNIETTPAMGAHEIAYRDELAARLKLLLKLPEYGTVKLKLTINRKGQVMKVLILSSESVKNQKLIEKTLPELTLPPFGSQFTGLEQFTFTITMSNYD